MKTIHMLDDNDVRKEVEHVLSCAYAGDDWMEDNSIRQDITDLKSNIVDLDDDIDKLDDKIKSLNNLVDNNLSVIARHDDKLNGLLVCINTLNEMVEMISKRVGLHDESE